MNRIVKGLLYLVSALAAGVAGAATIAVGPGDDLKAKVEAAASEDIVEVAEGTYTIGGEVTVPTGVTVTGAGIGKSFITSSNNGVRYMTVSAGATVEGFTFSGRQIASASLYGKAVRVLGTLRNCRVTGFSNGAHFMKGAVYVNNANALVEGCEIDNNLSGQDYTGITESGGVYLSSGLVRNCLIHRNQAHKGGGVYMTGGTLEACIVYRNKVRDHGTLSSADTSKLTGAGVAATGGTIKDCIITANVALPHCGIGGLWVDGSSTTVSGTIVRGNRSYSSSSAGFPDFVCLDSKEAAKFSGCSLPIAYGADCNTKPVLFQNAAADDYTVVDAFSVDKTSALVGDELTFEAAEAGDWTFTDENGTEIFESGKAKVVRSFPAGVYDVSFTAGGVAHAVARVFGVGEPSYAVSTAAELTAALALARDGATITVAEGTYALTKCIWLTNAVTVVGAGRDICKLTGSFSDRMLVVANKGASVSGFTIQGGKFSVYGAGSGKVGSCGSGVLINERGGAITDCRLTGATAGAHYQLGAVAVLSKNGRITHCIVDSNNMSYGDTCWCAGLYVGSGLVENCLVKGNSAYKGGAVGVGANGVVRNCTIVNNTVKNTCAGACVIATGGTFVNCLVGPNTSSAEWSGGASAFSYCAFVEADPPSGTSIRVASPYVNPSDGDYTILAVENGPVDHGTNYVDVAEKDLGGNDRVQGESIDIGCYEAEVGQMNCVFTVFNSSGFVGDDFGFTAEVINAPVGVALEYEWTFDNGVTAPIVSTDSDPVVKLGAGVYTVNLTITAGAKKAVAPTQPNAVTVAIRDLYANASAEGGEYPYDAPEKATSDIFALTALALDGSTIHFGAGTFTLTKELVLDKAITLSGEGWNKTKIRQSKADTRVMTLNHAGAVCENMSITDGKLTARHDQGTKDSKGIAVKIDSKGGTVRNCRIYNNTRGNHFQYGAIAVLGSAGHVDRCLIDGNHNLFQATSGDGFGAGVYISAGLVENCMITNNTAFTGGGAYVDGGTVRNCTFFKNTARFAGGARATGSGKVINCVFMGDTLNASADTSAGRPEWSGTGSCFENCAFVGIDTLPGTSSIKVNDPFVGASVGDLHPALGANGIADKGQDYAGADAALDFEGNPRVSGPGVDIGCLEADASQFFCSFDAADGKVEGFFGENFGLVSDIVNAPDGVDFGYDWKLTDKFGNLIESHDANPVLALPAGMYTVELSVYNADNPNQRASATPRVNFLHVCPRDLYATAGNADAAYPWMSPETGSSNLNELIKEAIDGCVIHIGEGAFTNRAEMVVDKGITLTGEGWEKTIVRILGSVNRRVLRLDHEDAVCEKVTLCGSRSNLHGGNDDGYGTGVRIGNAGGELRDCRVTDNVAQNYYQYGAGVSVRSSKGIVRRCIIDNNSNLYRETVQHGGGIDVTAGLVENCLVVSNTSGEGAGVSISGGTIRNCTIAFNRGRKCTEKAGGSYGGGYSGGVSFAGGNLQNCVFYGNTSERTAAEFTGYPEWSGSGTAVRKCGFADTVKTNATTGGSCVLFADPGFRDAVGGDFHLLRTSPLVNAGDRLNYTKDSVDLDGNGRITGFSTRKRTKCLPDLGCYESPWGVPGLLLWVR